MLLQSRDIFFQFLPSRRRIVFAAAGQCATRAGRATLVASCSGQDAAGSHGGIANHNASNHEKKECKAMKQLIPSRGIDMNKAHTNCHN